MSIEFDLMLDADRALELARTELRRVMALGDTGGMHIALEAVRVATERYQAAALAADGPSLAAACSWRPPHARHVLGTWTPRRFDKGLPVPQVVRCACESCGATWEVSCTSGLVRQKVAQFALVHLHRDPLELVR